MNRKVFLSTLTSGGFYSFMRKSSITPSILEMEPLSSGLVFEFVKAGHNDLDKVKKMLLNTPALLNCAWDWGNGDFETALGGASHLGNREIAQFLIRKGARTDIFSLTMLGHTSIIKNMIGAFPELLFSKGPHGFTLLHHARIAGKAGKELEKFFISNGLNETKFSP